MEMRASQDVGTSQDLTPPLLPLAASLRRRFLRTHCSSCFRPVLLPNAPAPLSCCGGAVRYCSTTCLASDSSRHSDSGECRLLCLMPSADDADLRVALRLLLSFQRAGLLPSHGGLHRIGGLLGEDGEEEDEQEESEGILAADTVLEGASILLHVREAVSESSGELYNGSGDVERAVLWIVLKNAVEVQLGEFPDLGIAVYGPRFSWFNHSCSPNACYRIELHANPGAASAAVAGDGRGFLVRPGGDGPEAYDVLKAWPAAESKMNLEMYKYGPKIIVRSIKRIRKSDEVCVTYVDLLQPKAKRRIDLLSKYCFLCRCCRCCQPQETYVDRALSKGGTKIAKEEADRSDDPESESLEELAEELVQLIEEHLSSENPEIICQNIENMLSESFYSRGRCKLHPLHRISLDAYITLSSIYKVRMNILLTSTKSADIMRPEAFEMGRASAAYSLLLACAIHHFFLCDQSVIGNAALFWVSAGDSLIELVKILLKNFSSCLVNISKIELLFSQPLVMRIVEGMSDRQAELEMISANFARCIKKIAVDVWPNLAASVPCLKNIESPVIFISPDSSQPAPCCPPVTENFKLRDRCIGCKAELDLLHGVEGTTRVFCQLAIHCLVYGGYLASICYGSECFLISQVIKNLRRTFVPF